MTPFLAANIAAPIGGVQPNQAQTIKPLRDSSGTTRVSAPGVPYAIVEVTAYNSAGVGELMVHACGVAPDPSTDVLFATDDLAEADAGNPATAPLESTQAIVPLAARSFCLTSTVATDVRVATVGYVTDDSRGAAYVDTSDVVLGTKLPIPLSGGPIPPGTPAVALMVEGRNGSTALARVEVGPCSGGNGQEMVGLSSDDYLSVALPMVPVATGQCLTSTGGFEGRITLLGLYRSTGESSPVLPYNMRFQRQLPPRFTGQNPVRVLDTRSGAPLASGAVAEIDLSARVPFSATAVVLNVTSVDARQDGYLTVYPCDIPRPDASNVNFATGTTIANAATIGLATSRRVCIYAQGATHVLVDLAGWYATEGGDGLVISAPSRQLDSRSGVMPAAGSTIRVDLSAAVPAGSSSAVINLTAVGASGDGYVTAYPCDQSRPDSSSLNYSAGKTVPNFVTAKLAADRSLCLFTSSATHLLVDLQGWYSPSSTVGFIELDPIRAFDSRRDQPGRMNPKGMMWLQFDTKPAAWLMNVTVVSPASEGYLTSYPCESSPRPTTPPNASNLNYVAAQVVPNQVLVAPGQVREVCFYSWAATDLIADLAGSFTATPSYTPYLAEP